MCYSTTSHAVEKVSGGVLGVLDSPEVASAPFPALHPAVGSSTRAVAGSRRGSCRACGSFSNSSYIYSLYSCADPCPRLQRAGSPLLCESQQPLAAAAPKKPTPPGFMDAPEPTGSEMTKWRKTFEQFATADSAEEGK